MDHITVPKIALHHIATVEKSSITSLGCPLILRCKNFRVAHFVLESDVVCHEVYIPLLKLSQPELHEDLYAFSYNPKSSKEMRENGLKLIDPISDFGRLGLPNRYWTITDANRNYEAVKVEKTNVLVHCFDGWDHTAQVCSVASIFLDLFCRTFKGLMILIEKEWISMGHKFSQSTRASHCCGLSRCGTQGPDVQAQWPWLTGLATLRHVGSSRTRAQTHVPCISRRTLNHCATREAHNVPFNLV
ncbi:myotubularin-related protein 8 isoform X2 [Pseudorca crassidens]|uniref:myotubularin-related protein 8 isoform X2 n=1 Tax=Pseudorca crassidens TaxID=82174 RepID=UPI00352DF6FA